MHALELNLGAKVHCLDGDCGKLAKVALEPDTWVVTHLIVEEGFLMKRARALPISLVARTTAEDIYLNGTADQLFGYPEYREEIIEKPDTTQGSDMLLETGPYMVVATPPMIREKTRHGVPQDTLVIERGTPVYNHEGPGGRLDSLVIEGETGQITQLVMHHGLVFTEQKIVPITNVEHMGERAIAINS